MERLNYHHLLYFYTVAQEGSVVRASLRLGLKQPTVSAQIHSLEAKLGCKLLERSGRGLQVTPAGKTVLGYAESIFALGGELLSALDGQQKAPKLAVGVSSGLPAVLVATLLQAILGLAPRPELTIVDGTPETFASQLDSRSLQFALLDAPLSASGLRSRVLLECAVEVFAPPALARRLRNNFPAHLAGAPTIMPSGGALCREVESWLASRKLRVEKLAEMPQPELFAAGAGAAVFAPSLLRHSLKKSHGLLPIGELEGSRWRLFAATLGRSGRNPVLDAVMRTAKDLH